MLNSDPESEYNRNPMYISIKIFLIEILFVLLKGPLAHEKPYLFLAVFYPPSLPNIYYFRTKTEKMKMLLCFYTRRKGATVRSMRLLFAFRLVLHI
jgi:hypothetical protein